MSPTFFYEHVVFPLFSLHCITVWEALNLLTCYLFSGGIPSHIQFSASNHNTMNSDLELDDPEDALPYGHDHRGKQIFWRVFFSVLSSHNKAIM